MKARITIIFVFCKICYNLLIFTFISNNNLFSFIFVVLLFSLVYSSPSQFVLPLALPQGSLIEGQTPTTNTIASIFLQSGMFSYLIVKKYLFSYL